MVARARSVRARGVLAAALLALLAGACVHVSPYQRGKLAHPTMLLGDLAGPAEAHVYAIQEGATGGASSVEGGCGCN
jgi:hypothetical protein